MSKKTTPTVEVLAKASPAGAESLDATPLGGEPLHPTPTEPVPAESAPLLGLPPEKQEKDGLYVNGVSMTYSDALAIIGLIDDQYVELIPA